MLFQKQSLHQFFLTTLALCAVLLLSGRAAAVEAERDAMNYFFHSSFKNLKEEAELAKQEGQQGIFIMFSDEDCPWCLKMKSTILNQVSVQDYYRKHFRTLHIDTKGDTMMADFSGKEIAEKDFAFKVNRVRATPVFMIFDLNGKDLLRFTGTARTSYEFNLLGEYIVSGAYKEMNFTRYKRSRISGLVIR